VAAGLQPEDLQQLTDGVAGTAVPDLITWLAGVIGARCLARDIRAASGRITELVQSVKVYSHMDRASDRERIDLRQGIDSTLVMLGHKLKRKDVALERVYSPHLPLVNAFAGELNQVWTNLVDNAIDAMPDHGGVLRIETAEDGGTAVVRVIDNGAGIPEDVQSRIFEAFFTTKPLGEGTGLGLDIVQRIVAQQHGGRVEVESEPGRTVLTVRLPIEPGA
jgi:signal transduction histidine kinase